MKYESSVYYAHPEDPYLLGVVEGFVPHDEGDAFVIRWENGYTDVYLTENLLTLIQYPAQSLSEVPMNFYRRVSSFEDTVDYSECKEIWEKLVNDELEIEDCRAILEACLLTIAESGPPKHAFWYSQPRY